MKKTFIIIFVIIGIIGLSGGAYWYLAIYQPTQYTEAFIQFDQEVRASNMEFDSASNTENLKDYTDALETIRSSKGLNEEFQEQLSSLSPPLFGGGKRLHKDALKVLDYASAIINDTEQRVLFFTQIEVLYDLLKVQPEIKPTVGEMIKLMENLTGQIKTIGDELFQREQFELSGEVSYDQLKATWKQGRPILDMMMTFLRTHDSNLSTSKVEPFPQKETNPEAYEAYQKFDDFRRLLEPVMRDNNARSILSFRSPTSILQEEEIERLNSRIKETLDDLKDQYSL